MLYLPFRTVFRNEEVDSVSLSFYDGIHTAHNIVIPWGIKYKGCSERKILKIERERQRERLREREREREREIEREIERDRERDRERLRERLWERNWEREIEREELRERLRVCVRGRYTHDRSITRHLCYDICGFLNLLFLYLYHYHWQKMLL